MALVKSLAKVGGHTTVSRILGFIRDLLLANLFGADAKTDAFFIAFNIPHFFRRLFAEGAFAAAFVPVLMEYKLKHGISELRGFIAATAGTLGSALLVIALLGVILAPVLVMVFAPGFAADEMKLSLATEMLRLTFPFVLFITLTAFAGAIMNAYNQFSVPAFTPVLLNMILIGCALWLAPHMQEPITAMAWGVLVGGMAQLTFQLPFLNKLKVLSRPTIEWRHEGVKRTLKLMMPVIVGVSVTQISLLLDSLLASFLVSGSISWLYYSEKLVGFPVGILGVALSTVILPSLSDRYVKASVDGFSQTIDWGLRWVLLIGLPASVGLLLLSEPIVSTLFQSASFDSEDVAMTGSSLMAYSLGLLGFILVKVLAPGYYAREDVRTPVRIAVLAMTVNLVFSIALVFPLAHAGLALATTIATLFNAYLLYRGLRRCGVYSPVPGWWMRILKSLMAVAVMASILLFGTSFFGDWADMDRWGRLWRLLLLIASGVVSYFAVLWLLGVRGREFLERSVS